MSAVGSTLTNLGALDALQSIAASAQSNGTLASSSSWWAAADEGAD